MQLQLVEKLKLVENHYHILQKAFKWEQGLYHHFIALVAMQKNRSIDVERIKQAQQVIKNETGVFSEMRAHNYILSALISLESNTVESVFHEIQRCEGVLKAAGFKNSQNLIFASFALYRCSEHADIVELSQKAFRLYKEMQTNHPWLTNTDDYSMSIMIAYSNIPLEKCETIYQQLTQVGFSKSNELQALSHILSFSDRTMYEVVNRCLALKEAVKANKLNTYSGKYSVYGIVSLISLEDPSIENKWIEAIQMMKGQKIYKWIDRDFVMLLASFLVSDIWLQDDHLNAVVATTAIESIIAAQMAAIMMATTTAVVISTTTT